jgi:hypothetical protein
MRDVSKIIKEKLLDVTFNDLDDDIVAKVDSDKLGLLFIKFGEDDDNYDVYNKNGKLICHISSKTELYDEDIIMKAIYKSLKNK